MALHRLLVLLSAILIHCSFLIIQVGAQSTPNYSEEAFDPAVEKLPPHYIGHDPEKLFGILEQRKTTYKKNEFETTEEYRFRIEKQQTMPILRDLTINSIFAFQYQSTVTAYDADHKSLEAIAAVRDSYLGDKTKYLPSKQIDYPKRYYEGTNAFGIRATVEANSSQTFNIILANIPQSLTPVKYIAKEYRDKGVKDNVFAYDAYVIKLNMDVSSAKIAKENIRSLIICKLSPPFAYSHEFNPLYKATIDHPVETSQKDSFIYANLLELWFYNVSTGELYAKLRQTRQNPSKKATSRPGASK